jgi:hypothetical protein
MCYCFAPSQLICTVQVMLKLFEMCVHAWLQVVPYTISPIPCIKPCIKHRRRLVSTCDYGCMDVRLPPPHPASFRCCLRPLAPEHHRASLDASMSRFQCFQVVTQAQTISAIQKHYGGALGSLKDDCISKWLEENRPGSLLFRLFCRRLNVARVLTIAQRM